MPSPTTVSVANVFAADGSRLVRVDDDGVTVFLPGGQEVRSDGAGVSATRWYTFAGSTVATRTGVGMGAVASVVTDAHGTPVAHVHNKNWAAPVNRVRTDPFGQARTGQVGSLAGRGFLGAPADPTGLTLLGARFYDPHTGTFVSVDPLLDPMRPAQFNAYVYSGNNPLTWADPTGEMWMHDPDRPQGQTIQGPVRKTSTLPGSYTGPPRLSDQLPAQAGVTVAAPLAAGALWEALAVAGAAAAHALAAAAAGLVSVSILFRLSGDSSTARADAQARTGDASRSTPASPDPDDDSDCRNPIFGCDWATDELATRHFEKHGSDFGVSSQSEYTSLARQFYFNRGNFSVKTDGAGNIRVYDPKTNTFGAYRSDGTIRTFFKPTSPTFWSRQPGS